MSDVSVYYFLRHGRPDGEQLLSKRQATLQAITDRGTAVIHSGRIVDHTEVDGEGFVIGGDESRPREELWPRIRSLESRAKSREIEASTIVDGPKADRKAALVAESFALRDEARVLRKNVG